MDSRDICRIARKAAGYTEEKWAEMLGITAGAVYQYEAGKIRPADDIVLSMATLAGMPVVCYWHMIGKSQVAAELLPEVGDVPIAQATIALLRRLRDFDEAGRLAALLAIAEDGEIAPDESPEFTLIQQDLREIIAAAMQVNLARTTGGGA